MISFAGVRLIDHDDRLEAFVRDSIPQHELHRRPMRSQESPPRPVTINSLWWPRGASRWAEGWFLASHAAMGQIREALYASDGWKPGDLLLDDGTRSVRASMHLLSPRPLSCPSGLLTDDADRTGTLWLLPLVDQRWFWQHAGVEGTSLGSTWTSLSAALVAQILARLPSTTTWFSLTQESVASEYLTPPTAYLTSLAWRPAPPLLDESLSFVGQRLVRQPDGTVEALNATTSQSRLAAQLSSPPGKVKAGGRLQLAPAGAGSDYPGAIPREVRVVFARAAAESVTLAQSALTALGSRAGPWTRTLEHPSDATGGSRTALAVRYAQDYYRHRIADHDVTLLGVVPWNMEGCTDAVEWRQVREGGRLHYWTRVSRPPEEEQRDPGPKAVAAAALWTSISVVLSSGQTDDVSSGTGTDPVRIGLTTSGGGPWSVSSVVAVSGKMIALENATAGDDITLIDDVTVGTPGAGHSFNRLFLPKARDLVLPPGHRILLIHDGTVWRAVADSIEMPLVQLYTDATGSTPVGDPLTGALELQVLDSNGTATVSGDGGLLFDSPGDGVMRLWCRAADGTHGGVVTTAAQTMAGNKTLTGFLSVAGGIKVRTLRTIDLRTADATTEFATLTATPGTGTSRANLRAADGTGYETRAEVDYNFTNANLSSFVIGTANPSNGWPKIVLRVDGLGDRTGKDGSFTVGGVVFTITSGIITNIV